MSFGNSIHKIQRIHTYADAHKFFTKTPQPPRSKKWTEDSRPLKGVSDTHYAIVRGDTTRGQYYDLCLYDTALIRYWKPDDIVADNTEEVWLRGYDTSMSWTFLSRHGWWQNRELHTNRGDSARLILNPRYAHSTDNVCGTWSAHLVFKGTTLQVERSRHLPVYVWQSSPEDTQRRAAFKRKYDTFATLMCYRIPEMHAKTKALLWHNLYSMSAPFNGVGISLCHVTENTLEDPVIRDNHIDVLNAFAERAYQVFISKRCRAATEHVPYRQQEDMWNKACEEPLDATEYKAKLLAAMLRSSGLNGNSRRVEVPQFPNKLPNKYSYY